jgi:hypothetical protein
MEIESFATKEQMDQRSQGAITLSSHPYLESELKAATRLIRDYCGWHIAGVESLTYRREHAAPEDVWLPAMEITSISAVTLAGVVYDTDALSRVRFDPRTGWTNLCGRSYEIAFVAGFAAVPEPLVSLTLQIAARALGSPLGIVREQAGTVSVTYSQVGFNQAGGAVILAGELATLSPYKLGQLP